MRMNPEKQKETASPSRSRRSRRARIVLFVAAGVVILALVAALVFLRHGSPSFSGRVPGSSVPTSSIPQVHSAHDANGNGIDDQIDILRGAKAYVATRPRYKSEYYQGGYPTDGYGVCTDVVAAAFKHAGYDLRELVDADIRAHPADYGISSPDPNIDYRRVRNLRVYFSHTARRLTTDIHDVSAWQGGDIVIFRNHIGIVSDKRDWQGIPYVIHHIGPNQKSYEEDILPHRGDITDHFRVR